MAGFLLENYNMFYKTYVEVKDSIRNVEFDVESDEKSEWNNDDDDEEVEKE